MNERFKEMRKSLRLTQEELGRKLGVQKSAISQIEIGRNQLTYQNKLALKREFNINLSWLETGEGEMFLHIPVNYELENIVNSVITSNDKFAKALFLNLAKAPEEFRVMLKQFLENVYEDMHKY